jgi:hypothetical protein
MEYFQRGVEALNPGLGYMMRQGIQTGYARVGFQPRPKGGFLGSFVRQFYFDVSADYYWDLAGVLATSTMSASPLSFRTQSGESFGSRRRQSRRAALRLDGLGRHRPAGRSLQLRELPAQRELGRPQARCPRGGLEFRGLLLGAIR